MPRSVGPYELDRLLGKGGMGEVWLARHADLARDVAIKLLYRRDSTDERRFRREMQVAAGISHPHIVKVFDGGVEGDVPYMVMELIDGESLHDWLRVKGALPVGTALALAHQVASGLAHLHERTILHRDVKPQNVMVLRDGTAKLTDFGLAQSAGSTAITADGLLLGTLPYLAPEIIEGASASQASDVYALGCLTYETLCGRRPFEAEDVSEWYRLIIIAPIKPASERVPAVPPAVSLFVARLLDRDPAKRPTAAAATAELEALANGGTRPVRALDPHGTAALPVIARPAASTGARARSSVRVRALAGGLALGLLSVGALAWRTRARPEPFESVSAAAESPASTAPARPRDRDGVGSARRFQHLRRQLAGPKPGSTEAARALDAATRLDLGRSDTWLFWFELEDALEGRGSLERLRADRRRELDMLDEQLFLSAARKPGSTLANLYGAAVRTLFLAGEDPRPWCLLGEVLARAGRPAAAARALERVRALPWYCASRAMPFEIHEGLVRAFEDSPELESRIQTIAERCPEDRPTLWIAVMRRLGDERTDECGRMLEAAFRRPESRHVAAEAWGYFLARHRGGAAARLAMGEELVRANPAPIYVNWLVDREFELGRVVPAHLALVSKGSEWHLVRRLLFDAAPLVPLPAERVAKLWYGRRPYASRLAEERPELLDDYLSVHGDKHAQDFAGGRSLRLAQLAAGVASPAVRADHERVNPERWDFDACAQVAGYAAQKGARPEVASLAQRLVERLGDRAPAFEALLASRAGNHALAVAKAKEALARQPRPDESVIAYLIEVAARPVFERRDARLADAELNAALSAAAAADPARERRKVHSAFLETLRTGDLAGAEKVAAKLADDEADKLTGWLVLVLAAERTGRPEERARRVQTARGALRAHGTQLWWTPLADRPLCR